MEKQNIMIDGSMTSEFQCKVWTVTRFGTVAKIVHSEVNWNLQYMDQNWHIVNTKFDRMELQLFWVLLQRVAEDEGWGIGEVAGRYLESEIEKKKK